MSTSEKVRDEYTSMIEKLKQQRDELKVQVHLAGMEAHDEWQKLEEQWHLLQSKGKEAGQHAAEIAAEREASLMALAHDVREGYRRIKKLF